MTEPTRPALPLMGRPRFRLGVLAALAFGLLVLLPARAWLQRHVHEMARTAPGESESCFACHAPGKVARPRPLGDAFAPTQVLRLPDGDLLLSAARDGSLLRLDPSGARLRARIVVGRGAHGLAASQDGRFAVVSLRDDDAVAVVDLVAGAVSERIPVGDEPSGLALAEAQGVVVVANTGSDSISVVDLAEGKEIARLVAGRQPYTVALSGDGLRAVVGSRLALPHDPGQPPATELTVVALGPSPRVVERRLLPSLHLSEGLALTADGALALLPAVQTHNLLPTSQVGRGWIASTALVVVELEGERRTLPILLDRADDSQADPGDLLLHPDGATGFLSVGGRDRVLILDLKRLRRWVSEASAPELVALGQRLGPGAALVLGELPSRPRPLGLALSADGAVLHVAESLGDSLASFDLGERKLLRRAEFGVPGAPSERLFGEQLFHRATAAFGQFSCRSCHPDGHLDGLTYDFAIDGVGENLLDNRSLRGLAGTEPFKWTGLNPSIEVQCGLRFVKVLGRGAAFDAAELGALRTFMESIPLRSALRERPRSAAAERGRSLFLRERDNAGQPIPVQARCVTCHPAPHYTSQTRAAVGSGAETDFTDVFDAAHLGDLRDGAPYLHDGRARTLHELLLQHFGEDRHGHTSDLDRSQINDLVEFLRSL